MLLFINGCCSTVDGKPADILSTAPPGVYTRFRTVQRNRILYMDQHVVRLQKSLANMLGDSYLEVHNLQIPHIAVLRQSTAHSFTDDRIIAFMTEAVTAFLKEIPDTDIRVDMHVSVYELGHPIFAIATPVPATDLSKDSVVLERGARETPTIKDTQWIKDRVPLESHIQGVVEEVILMDEQGYLYEGLSSNFVVIRRKEDGVLVLQTAGDEYVLRGTTRDSVLKLAKSLNMEVEMTRPHVKDIQSWNGVFITSTSRGVKPIAHVYVKDIKYDFATDEALRLKDAIECAEFDNSILIAK